MRSGVSNSFEDPNLFYSASEEKYKIFIVLKYIFEPEECRDSDTQIPDEDVEVADDEERLHYY